MTGQPSISMPDDETDAPGVAGAACLVLELEDVLQPPRVTSGVMALLAAFGEVSSDASDSSAA